MSGVEGLEAPRISPMLPPGIDITAKYIGISVARAPFELDDSGGSAKAPVDCLLPADGFNVI